MRYENLSPSPSSLIESLRDIGYSMETALADVIDNSITAKAKRINIDFSWNDGSPWLAIQDDGCGMSYDTLLLAMKLGSFNPLDERKAHDLGRFGLGLKTATFSQCRKLTVISKKQGTVCAMEWDLDVIKDNPEQGWRVSILEESDLELIKEIPSLITALNEQDSGTIVLWRKLDRLDDFDSLKVREKKLNELIDHSRNHLELIFHRFLAAGPGKQSLKISINSDPLIAKDPFNMSSNATIELPSQIIQVDSKKIQVQPYVLPHYTKVSAEEYEKYAGDGGYLHNQGFYVYRNKRLIIKSTWFRLMPKEELTKLIRVRVDIPNSLDHIWKIDVKKSNASPPEAVKRGLKQIISEVEYSGKRVFKQKGYKLESQILEPFWHRTINSGKVSYLINRKHPMIMSITNQLDTQSNTSLSAILKSIEASFPSDLYFNDFANSPESIDKPVVDEDELKGIISMFYPLFKAENLDKDKIISKLLQIEPMASNRKSTAKIIEQMELNYD